MSLGELKPVLTALVLPPASPLLLVLLGVALLAATRRRRTGTALALLGAGSLWLLSCQGIALLLTQPLVASVTAVQPAQLKDVQAIVVLGGGVQASAPEYGTPQPGQATLARARYGAWLARHTGKPLAFAGGVGWTSAGTATPPEAQVVKGALAELGVPLRWADTRSRDTAENAREARRLLAADGITRVAVVTDVWHMPRALLEFRRAGFDPVAAPTGFPDPPGRAVLDWLPSADGLKWSRQVLREMLGLVAARAASLLD